jgi:hypothetical protein
MQLIMIAVLCCGTFAKQYSYVNPAISINPEKVVPNTKPGRCVWSSLETLGRHHGVISLENIAVGKREANLAETRAELDKLGVRYFASNKQIEPALLEMVCKGKLGAVVGVNNWPVRTGRKIGNEHEVIMAPYHAIILIDYSRDRVGWIDTNEPKVAVFMSGSHNVDWFNKKMGNFIIVLEKEK